MGNCSTQNGDRITSKIDKQAAQAHFQASIKLDHYEKRQPALKKQAFDDVRRLINTANELIRTKQQQTMNEIQFDMKKIEANEKSMKKLFKLGLTVEEYVGLEFTKLNVADYKQRVESKFASIRQQLESNMETTFLNIRQKITDKMISFQGHPQLKKEQVDTQYYKWRLANRQKCKQCILELQNEFKDALAHDYFRNRLKHVVSIDDLKLSLKRKPMASLKEKKTEKSQISKTEMKVQEVEAFEMDTKSTQPGRGWLCCMPTQSTH